MKPEIFIQIPAYRDSELQPTLYDLIRKASDWRLLRIAVAWQYDERFDKLDADFNLRHNIEIIPIPAAESKGCNWARRLLQEKWNGEKYTLFLDSHHRFVPGWDKILVEMYEELRSNRSSKPLISAYLPVYDPFNEPHGRGKNPLHIKLLERQKGLMFRLNSNEIDTWKSLSGPVQAQFTSLHFLFAEGAFNETILFDPSIYFFADEIAIALRAFTQGYDLFHPHQILGWHLYNRSTRVTHWDEHPEWAKQSELSHQRLFRLYRGYITGRFGIGSERSVANYERYIGMKLIDTTS
ncbi:MAG TPA: GlcNAc-transferase family protein [Chitinophagaceae bacterium]